MTFKKLRIKTLFQNPDSFIEKQVTLSGWVRTLRAQKNFAFLALNDGSSLTDIQVILNESLDSYDRLIKDLATGVSLTVTGTIVKSPGDKQAIEMQGEKFTLFSKPNESYPLQKKRHSFEFLRTMPHLRPRTNTQGAVARVRNHLAYATHTFFQNHSFSYIQTPILTALDCEGAGSLFQVTKLPLDSPPKENGSSLYEEDFFKRAAFLTVSGQLNAEAFALALSDVYTFGPTFRAENSHTSRHLAEFWMIEPEMAFATLKEDMDCAEHFIKYLVSSVLKNCHEDLQFFDKFIEKGLIERLEKIASASFIRMSYTEAIDILQKSNQSFTFPHNWGDDLQSEHERYISENHCNSPVFLTDYPKSLKAFYMRDNEDGKTVAAMDLLVPKVGELIGGSQREERMDILTKKMEEHGLKTEDYEWYLDLRLYGGAPHAGFGVGFERLVQFITGMENIRDVIPFPRTPGQISC